jgi:ATP-dependent Clp protease protease subunit
MNKIILGILMVFTAKVFAKDNSPILTLTEKSVIVMNQEFNQQTITAVAKKAKEMDAALPSGDPITLIMDSPGGSIEAGLELIAVLNSLNRPVNTLSLFSASMGFHTVQNLGNRYILKDGTLMTHKARGGFEGEFPGQIDSRYSYYLKKINRMNVQVVSRTNGKHTLQSYNALHENEYWCDGQDCVDQGLADKVVTARCDKTLSGERVDSIKLIFMGTPILIELVYDKCPLIRTPLDMRISMNGKDIFDKENNLSYNTEQLAALDLKVKELIHQRNNRNVIRGY